MTFSKIIPYLRFTWAISLVVNLVSRIVFDSNDEPLLLKGFEALLTVTFVLYCIIIGLQEVRNEQLIHAKYFRAFGIFFEITIFIGGLFLLTVFVGHEVQFWRLALLTIWQVGLIILIFADIMAIRRS